MEFKINFFVQTVETSHNDWLVNLVLNKDEIRQLTGVQPVEFLQISAEIIGTDETLIRKLYIYMIT